VKRRGRRRAALLLTRDALSFAAAASRSISAVSALSSFYCTLAARFLARSTLAPIRDRDDDEPGLSLVEVVAEFLKVVAADRSRCVPCDRAEDRASPHDRGSLLWVR
jgi:hypothetical protein